MARAVGAAAARADAPAEAEASLIRFADRPAAAVLAERVDAGGGGDLEGDARKAERLLAAGRGAGWRAALAPGAGADAGGGASTEGVGAAGRVAAGDAEPVDLADHRAAGNAAQLAGDLAGRQPFAPHFGQSFNALVVPLHDGSPRLIQLPIRISPRRPPGRVPSRSRAMINLPYWGVLLQVRCIMLTQCLTEMVKRKLIQYTLSN